MPAAPAELKKKGLQLPLAITVGAVMCGSVRLPIGNAIVWASIDREGIEPSSSYTVQSTKERKLPHLFLIV
jgi:hypothetical protein